MLYTDSHKYFKERDNDKGLNKSNFRVGETGPKRDKKIVLSITGKIIMLEDFFFNILVDHVLIYIVNFFQKSAFDIKGVIEFTKFLEKCFFGRTCGGKRDSACTK